MHDLQRVQGQLGYITIGMRTSCQKCNNNTLLEIMELEKSNICKAQRVIFQRGVRCHQHWWAEQLNSFHGFSKCTLLHKDTGNLLNLAFLLKDNAIFVGSYWQFQLCSTKSGTQVLSPFFVISPLSPGHLEAHTSRVVLILHWKKPVFHCSFSQNVWHVVMQLKTVCFDQSTKDKANDIQTKQNKRIPLAT